MVRLLGGNGGRSGPDGPEGHSGLARVDSRAPQPIARGLRKRTAVSRDESRAATADLPPIPEKIYFRIGEVAHLVGVEPHVLRYWEHEFRSIRPTKSQRGQRVYSRRDVDHLRKIRALLYQEGFTIAGAKKVLRARGTEPHLPNDPTILSNARSREALMQIRNEVETFLRELGG
ncbi:MAG: hypothetical protein NVS3B20_12790 [Polyangiales bacterium]